MISTDFFAAINIICSTTGSRSSSAYYAAEDAGFKGTRYVNRNIDLNPDGSYVIR